MIKILLMACGCNIKAKSKIGSVKRRTTRKKNDNGLLMALGSLAAIIGIGYFLNK